MKLTLDYGGREIEYEVCSAQRGVAEHYLWSETRSGYRHTLYLMYEIPLAEAAARLDYFFEHILETLPSRRAQASE